MRYEVLVVGGGVGGLTVAALLAARGVGVCVLERAAQAGGCAAPSAHGAYEFEPGADLYAGWGADGIHARVFGELPVAPPTVARLAPAYVVRLPDGRDVPVGGAEPEEFETTLGAAFPECADAAVGFYRELHAAADALCELARHAPALAAPHALAALTRLERMKLLARAPRSARQVFARVDETAGAHLDGASPRFRRFVDAQLRVFAQAQADECAYLHAALALAAPRAGLHTIQGGVAALTDALAEAVTRGGGALRLNTTALRLALDDGGRAVGVDLLSGERVEATRAVVSNLTVWDTYGKLLGLNRTPADARARLRDLHGHGAYLIFAALDERATPRLPAPRVIALTDEDETAPREATNAQHHLTTAPLVCNAAGSKRAPAGQRAVTVWTLTDAAQWFAYHEDEAEHEAQDQTMLEACWARLHAALPELGGDLEVIETATPRTFYELTRRKLGQVGGAGQGRAGTPAHVFTHRTSVPNLFMVGDTVGPGAGLAAVTHGALLVANEIAPPAR
ncbi:MAG TPA: FAD-dependent oxidoreductase [Pyrinomonadaceae bacterium]|jgi:C-3',4' desaturase CrtD